MKIFLDTANLEHIKQAKSWGSIDGVTTNPTLVSREKARLSTMGIKDPKLLFKTLIQEIAEVVRGPVSTEVISLEAEGMVREARELASWSEHVVVKIPMTSEGLQAVKVLSGEGISTNVTLVFSPSQALLAAKAGATYVSPFIGRLDDISWEGMELVAQMVEVFANYDFSTQVLVASVRHPMHVVEAALLGADVATVPFAVLEKMFHHPLTDIGVQRFLHDWEKLGSPSII